MTTADGAAPAVSDAAAGTRAGAVRRTKRSASLFKADGMASLSRGLTIVDLVQRSRRLRTADIARRLDMPLSTAYRYVKVLREAGFLLYVDGYLVPSARFADTADESDHLVHLAGPILARMRDETGLTALLTVRVHTAAVCLEVAMAHARHEISFQRGHVRAIYAGASATPLLAFAPPAIVEEVLEGEFKRFTSATPGPDEVRETIQQIRRDGYAFSVAEVNPGMAALGVPVLVGSRCLCAISLVGRTISLAVDSTNLDVLFDGARELQQRIPPHLAETAWSTEDV